MKAIRKMLIGVGSLVVVALVLALATPKAIRAAAAALVTVDNTKTNPAITVDADKSTRIPYQSTQAIPSTDIVGSGVRGIIFSQLAAVQAGHRLVIQNISFQVSAASNNPIPWAFVCSAFNSETCFPSFTGVFAGGPNQAGVGNANVIRYIGPGDAPEVTVVFDPLPQSGILDIVTVSGYLEDCAVTGCPAAGF
jgi:hypothetical protein